MPRLLRRVLVPALAVLVVVAVAASVLGVGLSRRSFPQEQGELALPALQGPVDVLRDERGVAHIYADTSGDLFRAQGYVAAQDRFFQMDLRRHITAGRLSELVGPGGVETDTVIRTMGWRRVAEKELALLDPSTRQYLQAYAAGVNAYLEDKSPSQVSLEYAVLAQSAPDYQIAPWEELDSLTWLKAMAWDLRGNYEDELARARLAGEVPLAQLSGLYPDYPYEKNAPILSEDEWSPPAVSRPTQESRGGTQGTVEKDQEQPARPPPGTGPFTQDMAGADQVYEQTVTALGAVPPLVSAGEGVGSNSWVVSGEHTESGKPLLANDPHLGVTQPGVWLQAGLHCREVTQECPFDVTGFTFAGFPGVIIGHNQSIAWGLTNLDPDVTDFYLEDIDGDEYLSDDEMVPVQSRKETISVAGGEDVEILVRSTHHGPVLSDVLNPVRQAGIDPPLSGIESRGRYAVSMAWTGLEPARTAEAVFAFNAATNWEEFRAGAKLFAAPAQNLVYADTEGNIGYQAPGLVPQRTSATSGAVPGYWPAPGWDSAYDWQGWVPFDRMPFVANPEDGVIVTANQAVAQTRRPFLTTEWDMGFRAQRIADLLATDMADGPVGVEAMSTIQYDSYNSFASTLIPYLLDVTLENDSFYTEPVELLRTWDRRAPKGDGDQGSAAMYYYAVWFNLLDLTIDDELPLDLQMSGGSRSMEIMANLLQDAEDPWWDDQRTAGVVETRDQVLRQAMIAARLQLTEKIGKDPQDWQWGGLHEVTARHQVLGSEPTPTLVRDIFNLGPLPVPGGTSLVNANSWDAAEEEFAVTAAPSMRMVVDLDDLDSSVWVNQGGNSGHVFHRNYDDQLQAWVDGDTYPWPHSQEAVEDSAELRLRLVPDQGSP